MLSPLCFVLALQRVMQLHDTPTGVTLGSWLVTALEYADDQALLETDVWRLSQRTSSLQAGALASADMTVSVPKTEVLLFEKHTDKVHPGLRSYWKLEVSVLDAHTGVEHSLTPT